MAQMMTLRKADALAKALLEEARKAEPSPTVVVSIFDDTDINELANQHATESLQAIDNAVRLLNAGYEIRSELGHAFVSSGISDLLAERAKLDAEERLLSKVAAKDAAASATAQRLAKAKLTSLKEAAALAANSYRSSESLSVQPNQDTFDKARERLRTIRQRKSAIADLLLERNIKHQIEVSDDIVNLAEVLKLI
ncbi:hypothetical protein GURKE_01840 [Brevundimonas phage vB_BpoS-Gurke]|uniref:Uncharacterized protein n=1 Tax=Brevundimonas phage vB_BpoS-Gurke TaxID=2948599 RepID=A0A9E7N363_9CAUD|nr:hypothetical protein GURKE_01840 [Brevundimonas phage vB_BpoS-Gurke]